MKTKTLCALCTFSTLVGLAGAQQVNNSSRASAASNTSVASSPSGANVHSEDNANAASQTTVSAPERQRKAKEAEEGKSRGAKEPKGSSTGAGGTLAEGTTVNAVLAKPLDSKKCKTGDPVAATAAQDVKGDDGRVVIRKGSHLVGHVTEVNSKGQGETNSSLGILFDHAVMKDGQQVPMHSVVQALAAARTNSFSSVDDDGIGAVSSGSVAGGGRASGGGLAGGGLVGGVTSTAGAAAGSAANVGGGATGAVGSTLGATTNAGGGVQGALRSTSSGVVGLKGLSLASDAANATQGSIIGSPGKSVHLDSGTQMVLRVVNE